jgi:sugar transferase EpsL
MNFMVKWEDGNQLIKRGIDLIAAVFLLVVFLPVFVIVGVLVWIRIGPPIIFCQKRPGKNGKPFIIYKFRTMTTEKDKNGKLLSDTRRIKSLGCFLRRLSIDELPELFNVIKGDMSLVGPRPLLMEYLDCYTPEQARRHEVKPGITGWAQIHGRNNTPFSKRFAMDTWYVDNYSFWLDIKIIMLTIAKAITGEGIRSDLEKCYKEVNDCDLPDDIITEEDDD